jgi:hypothetical protein
VNYPRFGEGGGASRNRHQQIGCIAKSVVPGRQPVAVVVDVVEKDCPLRDGPKQLEPQIATRWRQNPFARFEMSGKDR